MAKKLKKPSAREILFGQTQPPTAAERLISNAKFLTKSVMDERVRITHIMRFDDAIEEEMTMSDYGQLYGHRIARIIGKTETESDCRRLILPGSLEVPRGEGEFELVPFEHNMLVYIVFDPAKHDPININIAATQILADAGSTDQAVWRAAVVSRAC